MKKKLKEIKIPITTEQVEILYSKCVDYEDLDGEIDIQTMYLIIRDGKLAGVQRCGETTPEPFSDEVEL